MKIINYISNLKPIKNKNRYYLLLFSTIPLLRYIYHASQGLDHLLKNFLVDDAFYFFEISRHIPYANNGVATNGFHPLYTIIIAPFHRFLGHESAILLSLLLLTVAFSISVFFVYQIIQIYWSNQVALIISGIWGMNEKIFSYCLMGMETVLAILFVLIAIQLLVALGSECDKLEVFIIGIILGTSFWARMDSPLIFGPLLFITLLKNLYRKKILHSLLLLLSTSLLPLAWISLSYLYTGDIVPHSAQAYRLHHSSPNIISVIKLKEVIFNLKILLTGLEEFLFGLPPLLCLIIIILGGSINFILNDRSFFEFFLPLFSGFLVWTIYYVYIHGGIRPWYISYLSIFVYCLVFPPMLTALENKLGSSYLLLTGMTLIVTSAFITSPGRIAPQEYDKYHSAKYASRLFVESKISGKIGSFNSGLYDYRIKKDIVNLDGVVNPKSLVAHKSNRLPEYLLEEDIIFILESEKEISSSPIPTINRIKLTKVINFSKFYPPIESKHYRKIYLWKIHVEPDSPLR